MSTNSRVWDVEAVVDAYLKTELARERGLNAQLMKTQPDDCVYEAVDDFEEHLTNEGEGFWWLQNRQ